MLKRLALRGTDPRLLYLRWFPKMSATPIVPVSPTSDFPLNNLPFGIITCSLSARKRPATVLGDFAVDLKVLADAGAFQGTCLGKHATFVFSQESLNAFMALGRPAWREARHTLQDLLSVNGSNPLLRSNLDLRAKALVPLSTVTNHLPTEIGDYTDFYASKEHATNVGTMFRGKDNALMPNWVHIPVGYHGRASSIVVSGTPIKRPSGIVMNQETKKPEFSVCRKLDFELEMACIVGVGNNLGDRIDIEKAEEHIFGVVLMNDWSARDIQAFEYVPLGPFLGKNFGTTISPWIVTLDALEEFRVALPHQDPTPSEYLLDPSSSKGTYDISLEVSLKPGHASPTVISKSNLKYMYWSFKQQLAHHTINGCNMRTGDLLGTGTISGPTENSFGSMLELSWNGSKQMTLDDGSSRKFIEDRDHIIITGSCSKDDGKVRLGFGVCEGVVLPPSFSSMKPKQ